MRIMKNGTDMTTKLTSLSDAIKQYVHDGDLVYASGFTHLIPLPPGMRLSGKASKIWCWPVPHQTCSMTRWSLRVAPEN